MDLEIGLNYLGVIFFYNFIQILVYVVEALLMTLFVSFVFQEQVNNLLNYYGEIYQLINSAALIDEATALMVFEFVGLMLAFIVPYLTVFFVTAIVYGLYFFPTFYLINEDKVRGWQAMRKGSKMMKCHRWQLFTLKLSFIGMLICSWFVVFMISMVLVLVVPNVNLLSFIITIIAIIIMVFLYTRNYQMALMVFYKEVVVDEEELKEDLNEVL